MSRWVFLSFDLVNYCLFDQMERPECSYVPKKECNEMDKEYCYKEEVVTTEKICDKKFTYDMYL